MVGRSSSSNRPGAAVGPPDNELALGVEAALSGAFFLALLRFLALVGAVDDVTVGLDVESFHWPLSSSQPGGDLPSWVISLVDDELGMTFASECGVADGTGRLSGWWSSMAASVPNKWSTSILPWAGRRSKPIWRNRSGNRVVGLLDRVRRGGQGAVICHPKASRTSIREGLSTSVFVPF